MKFFRAFISRAALAGFATALLPMAVAAQQANSSGGGEPGDVGSLLFDISLVCMLIGSLFVGMGVCWYSRAISVPIFIKVVMLGFLLQIVGAVAFICSQVFAGAAPGG